MIKRAFVMILAISIMVSMFGIFVNAAEYTEKFDYSTGAELKDALLAKWNYAGFKEIGTADGTKLDNGAYWMAFTDALHMKWKDALDTYEFKVDVKGGTFDGHNNPASIYLRTTVADIFGMTPFEETNPDHTAGHSGVVIMLHQNEAWIYVKKYDASVTYKSASTQNKETYTSHEHIKVTLPGSKNVNTQFVNFKVTDDGNKMSIYADDVLIATVDMSEAKDITMHETAIGTYYTKAVLTNVLTNETKNVTDARIAKSDATVSLAVRGCGMWVDNLYLKDEFAIENPKTGDAGVFFVLIASALLTAVVFKKKLVI